VSCELGTFATIDGPFAVCAAKEVTWDVPRIEPSATLDLSKVSEADRATLLSALQAETADDPEFPGDSYFGSKALYRVANLVQIADALGETTLADHLAAQLAEQLRAWADPEGCAVRDAKCLVYDPEMRGVVGMTPSFGSEEFNDHHFHYGYLLYAAAVAGARDASLASDIGPAFDLLADDIASPIATADFPQWRSFDPVAGHSWASGIAPFADGNNQESSSEAVAAWNAVALWRTLRDEEEAASVAEWMLAAEAEAARRVFLEPDVSAFPEFAHETIGIQWGSKRDFATWFSPEPNAIIGIQLIPSPPMAADYYSLVTPATVTSTLEAARGEGSGSQFADFLLMYSATQSPEDADAAWQAALDLPEDTIDDGNSRTYMLAWIASLRD
jgi:endoglucanase Acf2